MCSIRISDYDIGHVPHVDIKPHTYKGVFLVTWISEYKNLTLECLDLVNE